MSFIKLCQQVIRSVIMANPENENLKNQENRGEGEAPFASGGYQTPVDEEIRKTGMAEKSGGKESAVPESGSSDQLTEGGGNQGTEKR